MRNVALRQLLARDGLVALLAAYSMASFEKSTPRVGRRTRVLGSATAA